MGMTVSVPRYTVADLERFPDDGNRYELLDGVLIVTPSPSHAHQIIANRLQFRLTQAVVVPGDGQVVGPGAITLLPKTQLEPDILVYPSGYGLELNWEEIDEHWLAVEVLSRSSKVYDREMKRDAVSERPQDVREVPRNRGGDVALVDGSPHVDALAPGSRPSHELSGLAQIRGRPGAGAARVECVGAIASVAGQARGQRLTGRRREARAAVEADEGAPIDGVVERLSDPSIVERSEVRVQVQEIDRELRTRVKAARRRQF